MGKGKNIMKIIPFVKAPREYKVQSNAAISENLSADSLVSSVIVDVDNG